MSHDDTSSISYRRHDRSARHIRHARINLTRETSFPRDRNQPHICCRHRRQLTPQPPPWRLITIHVSCPHRHLNLMSHLPTRSASSTIPTDKPDRSPISYTTTPNTANTATPPGAARINQTRVSLVPRPHLPSSRPQRVLRLHPLRLQLPPRHLPDHHPRTNPSPRLAAPPQRNPSLLLSLFSPHSPLPRRLHPRKGHRSRRHRAHPRRPSRNGRHTSRDGRRQGLPRTEEG